MNLQRLVLASAGLIAALLAGCATPPPPPPTPANEVRQALEESLDKAAKIQPHARSADAPTPEANLSAGRITIHSYQNEASKLLARVAAARGMRFMVRGPEPRLPLFVSIDVQDMTFEDFLAEVGHQFGQRADIVLTNNTIEIRYRGM